MLQCDTSNLQEHLEGIGHPIQEYMALRFDAPCFDYITSTWSFCCFEKASKLFLSYKESQFEYSTRSRSKIRRVVVLFI